MRQRFLLLLFLLAAAGGTAGAERPRLFESPGPVPQPQGREAELLADAAEGQLDTFALVEAALIAEGVRSPDELSTLVRKVSVWEDELATRTAKLSGVHDRAAAVLAFLHRRVLTGKYDADCSDLSRTARDGDFNCITATLMYIALGRSTGLRLVGVQLPGHVRVRLMEEGGMEIETTCPTWPHHSRGQAGQPTSGEAQADARKTGRVLSDGALVAKIYYNRGIALLHEDRYAQSIAVTRTALLLDATDDSARTNMLAAYNNWALALCKAGAYADAAQLVIHAGQLGPDFAPLASNDLHIHQQWVLHLCEGDRFAEALAILDQGYRRRPDADLFNRGRDAVRRWQAESLGTLNVRTMDID